MTANAATQAKKKAEMLSAYEAAKAWLLAYLADGKHHTMGECFIRGTQAGHSEQMLRSAAKRNGVKAIEACYGHGRVSDVHVILWQLPEGKGY